MNHKVGITRNGVPVHVNLISSRAAKRIAEQPRLLMLAKEALLQTSPGKSPFKQECNLGRTIGYDTVVQTTEKDVTFYAQLLHEDIYTRFVKNSKPTATSVLSLHLIQADDGYQLTDIWIGKITPPRPEEAEATAVETFWDSHARIFSNQPLKVQSITKSSPY